MLLVEVTVQYFAGFIVTDQSPLGQLVHYPGRIVLCRFPLGDTAIHSNYTAGGLPIFMAAAAVRNYNALRNIDFPAIPRMNEGFLMVPSIALANIVSQPFNKLGYCAY